MHALAAGRSYPQQRRSIAVVVVCHRAAGCLRRAEAPHQRPQVDAVRLGCLSKPLPCVGLRAVRSEAPGVYGQRGSATGS
eukprot:351397-Chlamydomonas_euryale.AAC.1